MISNLRGKMLEQETYTDARGRYKPTSYQATGPNRVWTWDITYFRTSQYTGCFCYVNVIIDVDSRYIISARVYEADNDECARAFLSVTVYVPERSLFIQMTAP